MIQDRENVFFPNFGLIDKVEGSFSYWIFSEKDFEPLKALAPDVVDMSSYQDSFGSANLVVEGKRFAFGPGASATVDLHYFEMFPLTITRGYVFTQADAEAEEPVILLADTVAQKLFGDADPINQIVLKVPSHGFYTQDVADEDPLAYRVIGTFAETMNVLNTNPGIFFPVWAPEDF